MITSQYKNSCHSQKPNAVTLLSIHCYARSERTKLRIFLQNLTNQLLIVHVTENYVQYR